jgi:hypothetical protein
VNGPGRVVPPAGPLEQWPQVTPGQAAQMLGSALEGLALGSVDRDAAQRLTGLDPAIAAAVVASWIRRAFEAGLAAGRAEMVDEAPAVAAARAEAGQARADAEVYGRVIDEVVTAAADAEPAAEDDTADARAALVALLTRIERAAGLITGRRS